jgi:hypothetical protein
MRSKNFKRQNSRRQRSAATLPEALASRLDAYTLAATAAGIGLLGSALPANATPICQNISVVLSGTDSFALNPANQQIAPFLVVQTRFYYDYESNPMFWNRAFFEPNPQGVMLSAANSLPAAVSAGALIGPSGKFAKGNSYGLLFTYGPGDSYFQYKGGGTLNKHRGNFKFGQTNYVGFRFLLSGQYHYGWARIEVFLHPYFHEVIAKTGISSYGYETAADTAISAGDCPTPELSSNGASLGLLALGEQGFSKWREK